tara:strand:- start:1393 stop:2541 length:1149 start_codon:yes stop_codon:yes gene_type:complete
LYFYNKHKISKVDIKNVVKSLKSNEITKGKFLNLFENNLRKYFRSKYSLAYSNGTMALFAVAKCLGWNKKDFVILSPISFVAGANAVSNVGANPVFVDIDEYSNLNPDKVEKKILELKRRKKKVRSIIVTDYGGNPANWKRFLKIKKKYNLILINDNCHSLGSKIDGNKSYAIKFADIVVQSFHAVKNITSAEGGAILTNNRKFFQDLKSLREHGFKIDKVKNPWYYDMNFIGFNARISELNCALGYSQLKNLNNFVRKRNKIAKFYNRMFNKIDVLKIPRVPKSNFCSYHLYPLKFDWKRIAMSKVKFFNIMKNKYGINLQIHYKPTYKFKYYKSKMKIKLSEFPNSEKFYNETFSIPLHLGLTNTQLKYISKAIIKTLRV